MASRLKFFMAGAGDCTLGRMKRTVAAVVAACAVAIGGVAFLIRHPPANDALAMALGLGAIVVPIVVAVWIVSDRSPRAIPARQSPWLDVWVDGESVAVFGDAAGLEALGAECLRVAHASSDGETAEFEAHGAGTVTIERTEPQSPRPPTWRQRLSSIGSGLLLLAVAAVWLRGCIALEHDLGGKAHGHSSALRTTGS
jgi:hypothetical protein